MGGRKRKGGNLSHSHVRTWDNDHVYNYVLENCGSSAANAVRSSGIDGRTAVKLRENDLTDTIKSSVDRKKVAGAFKDLNHALMPAFLEMDTDESFTISSNELANVLTRVRGTVVTPSDAQALIDMADTDRSGDVDFYEFKEIARKSSSRQDWAQAAQAVGAPAALFAAGNALANTVDRGLERTHSDMQAGAARIQGGGPLAGFSKPGVFLRLFSADLIGTIMAVFFYIITLSLGAWYELIVLWGRGQTAAYWIMGMEYRMKDTGKLAGHFNVWLAQFTLGPLVNMCLASSDDKYHQTLGDMLSGVVVVHKTPGEAPTPPVVAHTQVQQGDPHPSESTAKMMFIVGIFIPIISWINIIMHAGHHRSEVAHWGKISIIFGIIHICWIVPYLAAYYAAVAELQRVYIQ